jgi:hypothetical protein
MNIEVSSFELLTLEVFRNFHFLSRRLGYKLNVGDYGKEICISYTSARFKRKVLFVMELQLEKKCEFYIVVYNEWFTLKRRTFNVKQLIMSEYPYMVIPNTINQENLGATLKIYSDFMQQHLYSILSGKEWIGEYAGLIQKDNA